jgi:branched-chain amino acid transport system substrate-binding protein
MNKLNKIILWIIAIVILLALIWLGYSEKEPVVEGEVIKIGYIGPLSGSGTEWGLPIRNSFEMAVKEINEDKEIFEVIYENGKCEGKEAVNAIQKLINVDEVNIVFSVCSAETLSILPITEENKKLHITVATHPDITKSGKYIFRNSYSDLSVAKLSSKIIYDLESRIGMIYELTGYPEGLKNYFEKEFKDLGGELVSESFLQNANEMRTQITKLLKKENIEAIFINPNSSKTGLEILKELEEFGFEGTKFGNYFGDSESVINFPASEGLIFFANPVVKDSQKKEVYLEKYKNEYNNSVSFEIWSVGAYDTPYLLKQAIDNVGYYDVDKITNYLSREMKNFSGVIGDYHFDENGEIIGVIPVVKQIKNGESIPYQPQ